ncbi:SAM-dependent methyltransferase [Streptomyces sp. 184]|uniref:SAM-dependent methyltransferase n=1 Tax=Streptomyces sp. 184 TaxID=1827526 RepID=UPI00389287F9
MSDNGIADGPHGTSPLPDPTAAHASRTYDYHLGGSDNLGPDRALVDEVESTFMPDVKMRVRAQRLFLERAVRYLVEEAGIRQILDIGCGLPQRRMPNVHEIAHGIAPDTRIVYTDFNPVAVAHMQALQSDGDLTVAFAGDVRKPELILTHPEARAVLDFDRPVGVLMVGLLHFLPDKDDPADLVARIRRGVPSGSHLAVSQISAELDSRVERLTKVWARGATPMVQRSRAELERIIDGWEPVDPGIVVAHRWRPRDTNRAEGNAYTLVAVKP